MIQPQELRIGNCVTINNPNSWIELLDIPMIVTGIDFSMTKKEKEIWAHSNGKIRVENGYNTYSQFSQFIDPIPLTEEILLKFGFDKGKIDWFAKKYFTDCDECAEVMKVDYNLSSKRLAIYDAIEETDMVNILSYPIYTGKRINYVHQLQNLYFALTGEELQF